MPWGYVLGRWYGNRKVRPILALHGWLDNLGSWSKLIPLLPQHVGVLCIDLPGHGFSSKLPTGVIYHAVDYVCVILRIMQEYNWTKVSILSHSMSSMISFIFAALYPNRLDMLICIDVVRSRYRQPAAQIDYIRTNIEKYMVEDERFANQSQMEPPAYTFSQLEGVLYQGSSKSVELANCHFLLERNIQKSTKYPDKYYFSRDGRLKYYFEFTTSPPFAAELAQRITNVPYCVIKGSESNYIDEESEEVIEILRRNNPHFELHEVTGTHHVHLNNADDVAAILCPFINRHRPPTLNSWSIAVDEAATEATVVQNNGVSQKDKGKKKRRKRKSKL